MKTSVFSPITLLLGLLAVQNICSALFVQYSRSKPEHRQYSAASAVFIGEIVKTLFSLVALRFINGDSFGTVRATLSAIPWSESLKLAVPAAVYTVQNNLVFIALQHIPSAIFQMFSQLKVLTTAVFSVALLGRSLHRVQWVGLVVLICGVVLAQLPCGVQDVVADEAAVAVDDSKNPMIGISAVCLLAVLSGFAGVYQEKIVKRSMQYPIHYMNIQLCLYSIGTNAVSVWVQDGLSSVVGQEGGILHGFTYLTWVIVLTQSIGGILVSLVIRYSSNLTKSYVVSVAIFATGLISYFFLDFVLTPQFFIGATLVTASVVLYNEPARWKANAALPTKSAV